MCWAFVVRLHHSHHNKSSHKAVRMIWKRKVNPKEIYISFNQTGSRGPHWHCIHTLAVTQIQHTHTYRYIYTHKGRQSGPELSWESELSFGEVSWEKGRNRNKTKSRGAFRVDGKNDKLRDINKGHCTMVLTVIGKSLGEEPKETGRQRRSRWETVDT